MKDLKQLFRGLYYAILGLFVIVAILVIFGGPFMLVVVFNSFWWLVLYTPHVLWSLYTLGE